MGRKLQPGDQIQLERRHSNMNGWSIKDEWHGKLAKVIEVEDRPNGGITIEVDGVKGYIFADAIGRCLFKEDECEKNKEV